AMQSSDASHLVLHPALRLRRQNNLLHVERSERQIELKGILKTDDGSTLWRLGRGSGIQPHIAADPDFIGRCTRATGRRRRRTSGQTRGSRGIDLGGIEIGRL